MKPKLTLLDAALIVWTILCALIWLNLYGIFP